jgi:hypothetical protein
VFRVIPGLTTSGWQPWSYRDESLLSSAYDLSGYGIAASDGEIGKVDQATYDTGASYLVVDTGPWIFGRKVMLPAGTVSSIDHENRRVVVDRTMDQIKNAPDFDEAAAREASSAYREQLGTYYGEGGAGWSVGHETQR